MKQIFISGPMFPAYLSGARVDIINITPCEFLFILSCNPNAKLAIRIGSKREVAFAKDISLTP
ncbi:MAG: hypothetical protein NUV64_02275 [Parcubacteria group bacterium]|nr:hypothetical protein [Parcubacteria group bacterium]MCR4342855.1 hypothetical protein [Patescibacteria group bacterium]